jgi:diadenosine tetraphosphate (Ap4A) HIT family hydrolase
MQSFAGISESERIHETERFFVLKDRFPVSPGHCLIVSKELKKTFFDLSNEERNELLDVIEDVKRIIEQEDSPDGYNIGMNCGAAAGQSVPHFHCHVIPRYWGDMENPRGGVRYCISEKGYWERAG